MLSSLADMLHQFCELEHLVPESADEMLCNPDLTDTQREWLRTFVTIWDLVADGSI